MTQPPIRPASTVVLVRRAVAAEVLLLLRHGRHGFMPNMWVFPGGRIEDDDGEGDLGARRAALRETSEEAGIELPESHPMAYFARWVTPVGERKRYDTRFYLSEVEPEVEAIPDRGEVIEAQWVAPGSALKRHARGELALAPPTLFAFAALDRLASVEAMVGWAREMERAGVAPITPQLAFEGGTVVVSVPPEHLALPPGEPVSGRLRLVRGVWREVAGSSP